MIFGIRFAHVGIADVSAESTRAVSYYAADLIRFGARTHLLRVWLPLCVVGFLPAQTTANQVPLPPDIAAASYILLESNTDELLAFQNPDKPVSPGSLALLMTNYVAARKTAQGNAAPEDVVQVSVNAGRVEGARMLVRPGNRLTVGSLQEGIALLNAGDAGVAIAEHFAASEADFVELMNREASALGMLNTRFSNSSGRREREQSTTAGDFAILVQTVAEQYPDLYGLYAQKSLTHAGQQRRNVNKLLWRDRRVEGTGSGAGPGKEFSFFATANHDGMHLALVVFGTNGEESGIDQTRKLLSYGFRNFETHSVFEPGIELDSTRVWYGEEDLVQLGIETRLLVTVPRGRIGDLRVRFNAAADVDAPVYPGDRLGIAEVTFSGNTVAEGPLIAMSEVNEAGWIKSLWHWLYLFFADMFD